MKAKNLIMKLSKISPVEGVTWNDTFRICKGKKYKCEFYISTGCEDASCVHISKLNDEWDAMRDNFPGFFVHTIKDAVRYVSKV